MTRLIPDWEIRVTNFGLGYILMCLVVAIAATNTGNNGLYLVLAAGQRGEHRDRVRLVRRLSNALAVEIELGVSGERHVVSEPHLDVRSIHAGVRADEAVVRLADHDAVLHADNALRLAEHDFDLARVLLE